MLEARYGRLLPGWLRRRLMIVESVIESAVAAFAQQLGPGTRLLDAGSGEGKYRRHFEHCRYTGVDLAVGDAAWDYSALDAVGDLSRLPFADGGFDAAVNIVVLEHTREPARVIAELARVLRPGGRLLLVAPLLWEEHQVPHDYFRFTRYGLLRMLEDAGFGEPDIRPIGGFFTVLARRLLNALNFFQGGVRWLLFPLVAAVVGPGALILPVFDGLDRDKRFTLAYVCWAEKL